ncbi:MAG: SMI1/KNR4 family protein [Planctomycetota bacterium]
MSRKDEEQLRRLAIGIDGFLCAVLAVVLLLVFGPATGGGLVLCLGGVVLCLFLRRQSRKPIVQREARQRAQSAWSDSVTKNSIARSLERLRAVASELESWHTPVTFARGLTQEEIAELQLALPAELPEDAVEFLTQCSAIEGPDVQAGYSIGGRACFAPARSADRWPGHLKVGDAEAPLTVIGDDGITNRFLLALGATNPVVKWDHESGGVVVVAESFQGFLATVAKDWEHYLARDGGHDYLAG